jgi:hypothetical protein
VRPAGFDLGDARYAAHRDLLLRAILAGEPVAALNYARVVAAVAADAGIHADPEAVLAAGAVAAKTATLPADDGPDLAAPRRKRAVAEAVAKARAKLLPADPEVSPYPLAALGPLAPAARAIAEAGQLPESMAGQSLLGAAALLAQSHRDVRTLEGCKPLSLYVLTIADSGEGKTTAERVALHPIRELQRAESERHRAAVAASAGKDAPPRAPYRIGANATTEGIRRDFATGVPSQGVFTSEAAAILGGYGMSAEHRAKSAAEFNALWDSGELSVSRALAGRFELHHRRLSAHWQIQPVAARGAILDPLLSSMGFWPRFLVAWPLPSAPRKARPFYPEEHQPIRDYWRRAGELLHPLSDDCSGLPLIECEPAALRVMKDFFEGMEREAKTEGGELESVRPFAIRAPELAFRVAGVLAVFEGRERINEQAARNACALVLHSVETWRGIFGHREESEEAARAVRLFAWLCQRGDRGADCTAISQLGPRPTRPKDSRDAALARLDFAGLIQRTEGGVWIALAAL